jgi:hypothetical protein
VSIRFFLDGSAYQKAYLMEQPDRGDPAIDSIGFMSLVSGGLL